MTILFIFILLIVVVGCIVAISTRYYKCECGNKIKLNDDVPYVCPKCGRKVKYTPYD